MTATKQGDGDEGDDSTTVVGEQQAKQRGVFDQYEDLAFTLHLRPADSLAVERCQQRIRRRFETLGGQWPTESVSTDQWYKRVSVPTSNPDQQQAIDLFDEFRAAVDEAGGRLTPFFDQRENDSLLELGSPERVIVFPVACATVRRDGDLVGLFPCWLGGEHYSVGDYLDRLENGESVTNLA